MPALNPPIHELTMTAAVNSNVRGIVAQNTLSIANAISGGTTAANAGSSA